MSGTSALSNPESVLSIPWTSISYAGVGARKTPAYVLGAMRNFARQAGAVGFTLRSGAATGADSAFESGSDDSHGRKSIFLPWKHFNSRFCDSNVTASIPQDAYAIAAKNHPAWQICRSPTRRLMARNVLIVLGAALDKPVDFLVCWTPGGAVTGGTGHTIRVAQSHKVPIFNLAFPECETELRSFIHTLSGYHLATLSA